jgi:hypothetical protein
MHISAASHNDLVIQIHTSATAWAIVFKIFSNLNLLCGIGMNNLFIGFLVLAVAALGIGVSTTAIEFSTANIGGHVAFAQSHSCPDGYHWENGECEAN